MRSLGEKRREKRKVIMRERLKKDDQEEKEVERTRREKEYAEEMQTRER